MTYGGDIKIFYLEIIIIEILPSSIIIVKGKPLLYIGILAFSYF